MPGKVNFDFSFANPRPNPAVSRISNEAKRILILGNFSGSGANSDTNKPIAERGVHLLDIDTFDQLLTRFKPRIDLKTVDGDSWLDVEISELDDFHPDALLQKLDLFRSMREIRKRLLDPATFAEAAADLNLQAGREESIATSADQDDDSTANEPADQTATPEDDGATLARLLGKSGSAGAGASLPSDKPGSISSKPGKVDLTALIRDRVAPYIVPDADPRQDVYVDSLNAAIQDQMRLILHHRSWQAVESSWRALHWIVTSLEVGEELEIYICDITGKELADDLRAAADNLETSGLHRLIVEKGIGTPGGASWSLIVGDFYFGPSDDEAITLAAMGAIASQAGAPFIAGAKAELLGIDSIDANPDPTAWPAELANQVLWNKLRRSPGAAWVGLALPRVLLRIPYGKETDEIDSFPFEELPGAPDHQSFLWGNAAFAAALVVGRSLLGGGVMQPGDQIIDGLPAYIFYVDDSKMLKPAAEVLLSERAGQAIRERGLIPLLSYRDRNAVAVIDFPSLADPLSALPV